MSKKKTDKSISLGKILSIALMMFCLTFLTSLNFFLYSSDNEVITQNASPSGPTEEKTGNNSVSIVEELLHENSFEFDFQVNGFLFVHHITDAEKLQIVHPELILRPPRA